DDQREGAWEIKEGRRAHGAHAARLRLVAPLARPHMRGSRVAADYESRWAGDANSRAPRIVETITPHLPSGPARSRQSWSRSSYWLPSLKPSRATVALSVTKRSL